MLDSSGLIMLLRGEPGADLVASALDLTPTADDRSSAPEAAISSINYSDVKNSLSAVGVIPAVSQFPLRLLLQAEGQARFRSDPYL